jgi:hypothetical protein
MLGIPFTGITEAIMLCALGIGYIVVYLARREEKGLQLFGYYIGGTIIVLSLIYIIVSVFLGLQYQRNMLRYNNTMIQPHMMQPRTGQPAMPRYPAEK